MLAQYMSPLGPIVLTFDGEALIGLRFGVHDADCVSPLPTGVPSARPTTHYPLPAETFRWLDLYFSGWQPDFMPPIKLIGTAFQRRVWQALLEIPYGETTTYGDIARSLGCRSAQAVGQAVGKNPIAVIVPCHRVVGSDGSMTGYAYGLDKKQYLLQLEKQHNPI